MSTGFPETGPGTEVHTVQVSSVCSPGAREALGHDVQDMVMDGRWPRRGMERPWAVKASAPAVSR